MLAKSIPNQPEAEEIAELIRPKLTNLEQQRQAMRKSTQYWIAIIIIVPLLVNLVARIGFDIPIPFIIPLFFSLMITMGFIGTRFLLWSELGGRVLVPEIWKAYGCSLEYRESTSKSFLKPFVALQLIAQWRLINNWRAGELKYFFRGQYRGLHFESVFMDKIKITSSKSGTTSSTNEFFGFLFRIQTLVHFEPGLTIWINSNNFSKKCPKRTIPTGNEDFDSTFLVTVDDDREINSEQLNHLLTPDWQKSLLALNEEFPTLAFFSWPKLQIGIKGHSLYLTLSREERGPPLGPLKTVYSRKFPNVGNLIATGGLTESALKETIEDVGIFRRIIDRLPEANYSANN